MPMGRYVPEHVHDLSQRKQALAKPKVHTHAADGVHSAKSAYIE